MRKKKDDMPNKRSPSKKKISAWIDSDTKDAVQKILAKQGLTITDEILKIFNDILQKEIDNEKSKRNDKKN